MVGRGAVVAATEGKTGVMMTIDRVDSDDYITTVGCADIEGIANAIKKVPDEYINDCGNGITEEGMRYLKPLIIGELSPIYEDGVPKHMII